MTVSPTRPSDGNRPSDYVSEYDFSRNRGDSASLSDSAALPPVLFKLRNLAAVEPVKQRWQDANADIENRQSVAPNASGSTTKVSASTFNQQSMASTEKAVATVVTRQRGSDDPVAASEVSPTESQDISARNERPTGRTWMELATAHRNVLVLLAIVIAMALWTSRKSTDSTESDSALAETGEMLDIDAGDLMASGDKVESVAREPQPSVSLQSPLPTPTAATPSPTTAPDMSGIASVAKTPADAGVPASRVSNRTSQEGSVAKPSLDDWLSASNATSPADVATPVEPADLPSDNMQAVPTVTEEPTPALSRTPAAVGDWLRFLPPPSEMAAVQ